MLERLAHTPSSVAYAPSHVQTMFDVALHHALASTSKSNRSSQLRFGKLNTQAFTMVAAWTALAALLLASSVEAYIGLSAKMTSMRHASR